MFETFGFEETTAKQISVLFALGVGGVLAGGCTVGAGLSGVPTLSLAAMLALLSIAVGALVLNAVLSRSCAESDGSSTKPAPQPAA